MSDLKKIPSILYEAYKHYETTGDKHFVVLPKNPKYLMDVLTSIDGLQKNGFVSNVSDNLINYDSIHLSPMESMSFDITFAGIQFIERNRKR